MTTDEAIAQFDAEFLSVNNIERVRARESMRLLRQLEDHAERDLLEVDANDLRSFVAFLTEEEFAITTIAKKLFMLRPFFKWAWSAGHIDAESYMRLNDVSPPRGYTSRQLPRPYSPKELRLFWEALDKRWPKSSKLMLKRWNNGTSHYKKVQPSIMRVQIEAIVALALNCGLRRNEIFEITIDDMHYDNAYVVVRKGKGGKFREVPHTETSRAAVKAWLELRTTMKPKHDSPWLCLAWKKIALQPMRKNRFFALMRTMGQYEYHRFRHTYGTAMLRATGRIEVVQRLLGHSRIEQTLVYAQLVNDDLLSAVAKNEGNFEEALA